MNTRSLHESLERLGLFWATVLLVALASSLIYSGPSLWQTWMHEGPTLINPGGFVTGHDFVAFYAASEAVLGGQAAMVYDRDFMLSTQVALVGSHDIGYLAFMYPPMYLLLVAPLAVLPYFPALALWQTLPFAAILVVLRRIALPPVALVMAAGAPAVAQTLFAGQNGLVFALCLGGGLLALDRRPLLSGLLFGLATAKPQLAILILPALLAGREWKVLASLSATVAGGFILSWILLGPGVWSNYLGIPADARHYLAVGELPWSRMPTVYTAVRLAGFSDFVGMVAQGMVASLVVAGVAWIWWRDAPSGLRAAAILAGVPLVTPFLYDYDLPFMLFAVGLYLANALERGPRSWEKIMLLLVWLQPAWWWWQLVEATGISLSPLVYAGFFAATVFRAHTSIPSRERTRGKKQRADTRLCRP